MLILTYLVNSFWFFHRRIINACVEGEKKEQIISFCKRVEGKFKPLKEKQQG
jgi:rRNA processing protein Krr1/Pno1